MIDDRMTALSAGDLHWMISYLRENGYAVRHKSEATRSVSWHHVEPVPDDFKERAVEELRKQVAAKHVDYETYESGGQNIRSAYLRIL